MGHEEDSLLREDTNLYADNGEKLCYVRDGEDEPYHHIHLPTHWGRVLRDSVQSNEYGGSPFRTPTFSPANGDDDEKVCRICADDEEQSELIAPCRCSGSVKYVHRSCLDKWRSTTLNREYFLRCSMCKQVYVLDELDEAKKQKRVYQIKVARDIVSVLLVIFAILAVCEVTAAIINYTSFPLQYYLPEDFTSNGFFRFIFWFTMGIGIFLAGFGLLTLFVICCLAICNPYRGGGTPVFDIYLCYICIAPHPHNYGYVGYSTTGCNCDCGGCDCCSGCGGCNGCDCGGCNCDCGGGDCGALAIVLLIIFIILIIIGLIALVFVTFFLVSVILKRHLYVLEQDTLTKVYKVRDLSVVV